MINRREIMVSGIAVTLLARASGAAVPAASDGVTRTAAGRPVFIADERYLAGRRAAHAASSAGAQIRPMRSDVTPVYEWLDLTLRASPRRVAGLATPQSLFVIERLAWDRGLRTVYRGIHWQLHEQTPSHELFGSAAIVERIRDSASPGHGEAARWPDALGHELTVAAPTLTGRAFTVDSQWLQPHDEALASWLLIPRREIDQRELSVTS